MAIIRRDSDQLELRRRQSDLAFKTMENLQKENITLKLEKRLKNIEEEKFRAKSAKSKESHDGRKSKSRKLATIMNTTSKTDATFRSKESN